MNQFGFFSSRLVLSFIRTGLEESFLKARLALLLRRGLSEALIELHVFSLSDWLELLRLPVR